MGGEPVVIRNNDCPEHGLPLTEAGPTLSAAYSALREAHWAIKKLLAMGDEVKTLDLVGGPKATFPVPNRVYDAVRVIEAVLPREGEAGG